MDELNLIEIFHDPQKNYDFFTISELRCSKCHILLGQLDMTFQKGELKKGFELSVMCTNCK